MAFDLEKYFERINWRPGNEDPLEKLRMVHFKHITSIPFENLDVYNKKTVLVDPESVYEKLVLNKRGGYCFEMNCLLHTALCAMGYDVRPYLARISIANFGFGPYTHRINIAQLGDERYLLDVGYGGNCFALPVKLEVGLEQKQLWINYREVRSDVEDYVVQIMEDGKFVDMLGFNDKPAIPMDFEIGNFYTNMHPSSFFRDHIMCAIYTENGKVTLFDNNLTIRQDDKTTTKVLSKEEMVPALKRYFNIDAEGLV